MAVSADEIERRMEVFREACRSAGLKLTHQRLEVFREVAGREDHPDAETIFERVRERVPTVSLDTVYRTLSTLEGIGVLQRIHVLCDRTRFDANMGRHHHFVCSTCGLVRDFTSDDMDGFRVPEEVATWGEIQSVHLELRGVCSSCASHGGRRPSPRR